MNDNILTHMNNVLISLYRHMRTKNAHPASLTNCYQMTATDTSVPKSILLSAAIRSKGPPISNTQSFTTFNNQYYLLNQPI